MRNVLAPAPIRIPQVASTARLGWEFRAQNLEVVTESERPIQLYPKVRWNWTGWKSCRLPLL